MTTSDALILVIDDQAANLMLLSATLRNAGYQVAAANHGATALKILQNRQPDLILCDVIMPEIDGYEVCRQVQANSQTRDIPLIFLTAQTESEQLLKGFEVGAVDYIAKPFNPGELLVRVKTHIELKKARDTILAYSQNLEHLNSEKNHFLGIAAHDLKNPLANMIISTEMVEFKANHISISDIKAYMQIMHKDAKRMLMIVNNLLDVNRIESGKLELQPEVFDLNETCLSLSQHYQDQIQNKDLHLHLELPIGPQLYRSDPQILYQILDNLFSNAIKYSSPQHSIWFRLKKEDIAYQLEIEDQGPGFSDKDQQQVFQKFARLSAKPTAGESSTGLGLSIVKLLSDQLNVFIDYETEVGKGTCFKLRLPILEPIEETLGVQKRNKMKDLEF